MAVQLAQTHMPQIDKNSWDFWRRKQTGHMQLSSPVELIESVAGKSGNLCEAHFATLDITLQLADFCGSTTRARSERGLVRAVLLPVIWLGHNNRSLGLHPLCGLFVRSVA